MLPKIKEVKVLDNYTLDVIFEDGKRVHYNVIEHIKNYPNYNILKDKKVFENFTVNDSKTVIVWNKDVDLPSHDIYDYGSIV